MNIKNITHTIQGLGLQNIPFDLKIPKKEVYAVLMKIMKIAFKKNKQLGNKVELLSIEDLVFNNDKIIAHGTIRSYFESKLMPNYSDIQVEIKLDWTLHHQKPFILNIEIDKKILSEGMAQKLIGVAADTFLLFKEEAVLSQLTEEINQYLQDPNTLLPWIQSIAHDIEQVNYELNNLKIETLDDIYSLHCTPNISANYIANSNEQTIYLSGNEHELKPILLDIIRTNIPNIDHVELDIQNIGVSAINQIKVEGDVNTHGMNISFDMELKLHIEQATQRIAMEVIDIIPKGNFFVRKTFQLAAPVIKKMIEEKAKIDLNIIKSKLPFQVKNENLLNTYYLDIDQLKIIDIEIIPINGNINHTIVLKDAIIQLNTTKHQVT